MLKLCTRSLLTNVYKRVCRSVFILFRIWVICQNKKGHGFYILTETRFVNNSRCKQNQKNSEHSFADIVQTEACAKFQQKILNSVVVRACQNSQFFRQITWFLRNKKIKKALSKFKHWILHDLISIIKLQNNYSVKRNFKLTTWGTLKKLFIKLAGLYHRCFLWNFRIAQNS